MSISFGSLQNQYSQTYYSGNINKSGDPAISGLPLNNVQNKVLKSEGSSDSEILAAKKAGKIECQTCKNRTYQDGSNDPGVSFKTPGHIDPGNSASVVMAHEQEHVKNETAKASGEGRKVVSQSVTLETSVCPECGISYVSGGKTKTLTQADNNNNDKKDLFLDNYKKLLDASFGKNIDIKL